MYNAAVERLNKIVTNSQDLKISGWSPKKGKTVPSPDKADKLIQHNTGKYTCLTNPTDNYLSYFDEKANVLTVHHNHTLYTLSVTPNGFLRLCKNGKFVQTFCSEDVIFDGVTMVRMKLPEVMLVNRDYLLYAGERDYIDCGRNYIIMTENESECIITNERTKASISFQLLALLAPLFYRHEPQIEEIYLSGKYLYPVENKIKLVERQDLAVVVETKGVTWYIANKVVVAEPLDGEYNYLAHVEDNYLPGCYKQLRSRGDEELSMMVNYAPDQKENHYVYPFGVKMSVLKPDSLLVGDIDSSVYTLKKVNTPPAKVDVHRVTDSTEEKVLLSETLSWEELRELIALYPNQKGMTTSK